MSDELEAFKDHVREYCELDNMIKESTKELKVIKSKHADLKRKVLHFMASQNLDTCNVSDGKINRKRTKTVGGFNKGDLKNKISEYFQNEDNIKEFMELNPDEKAQRLFNYYEESRKSTEKDVLRRSVTK